MSEQAEARVGAASGLGFILGLLSFLAGVAVLLWVFWTAKGLYALPPEQLVRAGSEATPNLTDLAQSASATLLRLLILVVMAVAGGLLAAVGAKLLLSPRRSN